MTSASRFNFYASDGRANSLRPQNRDSGAGSRI
jgi:hypothetical protein